jgi:hypothetical protein
MKRKNILDDTPEEEEPVHSTRRKRRTSLEDKFIRLQEKKKNQSGWHYNLPGRKEEPVWMTLHPSLIGNEKPVWMTPRPPAK